MSKNRHDSSFYCGAKGCPKTAWDTPEYMTPEDWALLEKVVELMKIGRCRSIYELLFSRASMWDAKAFFDRVLGWPEGHTYCYDERYWEKTAYPGLVKHKLAKMEGALKNAEGKTTLREV